MYNPITVTNSVTDAKAIVVLSVRVEAVTKSVLGDSIM